jgi:hypothetical protein
MSDSVSSRLLWGIWLREALAIHYEATPRARPDYLIFGEKHFRIEEDVPRALADAYNQLDGTLDRAMFRRAVTDAILWFGSSGDASPPEALTDLLALVAEIKSSESLDAVTSVAGYGALARSRPDVLTRATATLSRLAPVREARISAGRLLEVPDLRPEDGLNLVRVLISCDPPSAGRTVAANEENLVARGAALASAADDRARRYAAHLRSWSQWIWDTAPDSWLADYWRHSASAAEGWWLRAMVIRTMPGELGNGWYEVRGRRYPLRAAADRPSDGQVRAIVAALDSCMRFLGEHIPKSLGELSREP